MYVSDSSRLRLAGSTLAIFFCVVAAVIQVFKGDFFVYWLWADRDMLRAATLSDTFQIWGAELNRLGGARAPGAIIYYVFSLFDSVFSNVEWVYKSLNLIFLASTAFLAFTVYRIGGLIAGSISFLVIMLSPVSGRVTEELWNPFIGYIFCILGVSAFLIAIQRGRTWAVFFAFFLLALATQSQMANGALLLTFVAILIWRHPKRASCIAIGALLLSFLPLLSNQIFGYPNAEQVPGLALTLAENVDFFPEIKVLILRALSTFSVFNRIQLQVNCNCPGS